MQRNIEKLLFIPSLLAVSSLWLGACAAKKEKFVMATPNIQVDLDSLFVVNRHQDSVDANLYFYEHAFEDYHKRFPGVDKPSFMRVAKGKDQAFCLFKPDPAKTCLQIGDKFIALGLDEPARQAYEAGLVSEGVNEGRLNIRFWAGMGKIHFERGEFDKGAPFLAKVLEVEPKHKDARKLMASVPRPKSKG